MIHAAPCPSQCRLIYDWLWLTLLHSCSWALCTLQLLSSFHCGNCHLLLHIYVYIFIYLLLNKESKCSGQFHSKCEKSTISVTCRISHDLKTSQRLKRIQPNKAQQRSCHAKFKRFCLDSFCKPFPQKTNKQTKQQQKTLMLSVWQTADMHHLPHLNTMFKLLRTRIQNKQFAVCVYF